MICYDESDRPTWTDKTWDVKHSGVCGDVFWGCNAALSRETGNTSLKFKAANGKLKEVHRLSSVTL